MKTIKHKKELARLLTQYPVVVLQEEIRKCDVCQEQQEQIDQILKQHPHAIGVRMVEKGRRNNLYPKLSIYKGQQKVTFRDTRRNNKVVDHLIGKRPNLREILHGLL